MPLPLLELDAGSSSRRFLPQRIVLTIFLSSFIISCQNNFLFARLLGSDPEQQHAASIAALKTMDQKLAQITSTLIAIRSISIAANNGTYNHQDKKNFSMIYMRHIKEIHHLKSNCVHDGQPLLDSNHKDYKPILQLTRPDGTSFDFSLPVVLSPVAIKLPGFKDTSRSKSLSNPEWHEIIGQADEAMDQVIEARVKVRTELQIMRMRSD